jgi:hypothetical protein
MYIQHNYRTVNMLVRSLMIACLPADKQANSQHWAGVLVKGSKNFSNSNFFTYGK